jgi:nitroreductase
MNTVIEAIETRRSIRSYQSKPVPPEMLTQLIQLANKAPSGMNAQPWRFVVVQDPELKQKLVRTAVPNSLKYLEVLKESNPARHAVILKRYAELPDPVYYSAPAIVFVIGCGPNADDSCPLACGTLMLAAQSLGIGSCWVKLGSLVTDNPEVVQALGLKQGEKIYGPILLGYPKDIPPAPPKKEPSVQWI